MYWFHNLVVISSIFIYYQSVILAMQKKLDFVKLYLLYASFIAADTIAWSLGYLYFYKQGISFEWLLIFSLIIFGSIYLTVMNSNKFNTRKLFMFSFSVRILVLLVLSFYFSKLLFYIIALLQGISVFSYWIAFNNLYFRIPSSRNRAFMTAIYILIFPLLGLILPTIAGSIAAKYGYNILFLLGAVIMFIPLVLSFYMPSIEIKFNAHSSAVRHKKLKLILFLQGIYESVAFSIPIFVLAFIQSELSLGLFLSYLSLAGIIGSLIIAKLSDKYQSRKLFIYPLTIVLAILILLLSFNLNNFYIFSLLVGVLSTIGVLVAPFFITIVFDNYKNVTEAVIAREAFLSLGRFFGTLMILANFVLFRNPSYAFIVIGLLTLLYPYLVWKHRIYAK